MEKSYSKSVKEKRELIYKRQGLLEKPKALIYCLRVS